MIDKKPAYNVTTTNSSATTTHGRTWFDTWFRYYSLFIVYIILTISLETQSTA